MSTTPIEWTRGDDGAAGESWNPIVGCSIKSPGCTNCYAMPTAARLVRIGATRAKYEGTTRRLNLDEASLEAPLRWKAEVVRSNRIGASLFNDLSRIRPELKKKKQLSAECPRNRFVGCSRSPHASPPTYGACSPLRNRP